MYIEHVAIWARNLELLKIFYEKYFQAKSGEKYVNPTKKFESYFLSFESGARLELMHRPDIPEIRHDAIEQYTGIIHFAFSLGSENAVDRLTKILEEDGIPVIDGPRRTGDGYYESVVLDPEGNRIEISS